MSLDTAPPDSTVSQFQSNSHRVRDVFLLLLSLGLGLAGAGLLSRAVAKAPPTGPREPPPRGVEIQTLKSEDYRERVVLDGIFLPLDRVQVASEVRGRLLEVLVREGVSVEAGEVLARVDSSAYVQNLRGAKARLRAAQAKLDELLEGPRSEVLRSLDQQVRGARAERTLATTELKRVRLLHSRKAMTQAELDRATSRLDAAQAGERAARARQDEALAGTRSETLRLAQAERDQVEAARDLAARDLALCELRAPFAGVVEAPPVAVGTFVAPGTPVVQVIAVDEVEAMAGVPEKYLEIFAPGKPVLLVAGKQRLEGEVESLAPNIDLQTRTYAARVRLANSDHKLRVGHSLYMIAWKTTRPALILPPKAVLPTAGGSLAVYRAVPRETSGQLEAQRREVSARWLKDGRVEIVAGLVAGDDVVVTGGAWLLDGDPVENRSSAPDDAEGHSP